MPSVYPDKAGDAAVPVTPWNWKLTVASALLYTLAFNSIFFTQELFLVLPKALTPGPAPDTLPVFQLLLRPGIHFY